MLTMDDETIRSLCVPWLDLSDAFALRCVSKGWRQTLNEQDDELWEKLIDATHGKQVANALRKTMGPLKGFRLAERIHCEEEHNTTVSLQQDDVTCLVEMSRTNYVDSETKRRKIHMASFVLENFWNGCAFS